METLDADGLPAGVRVEALPVVLVADSGNQSVAPRPSGIETPQRDPRVTAAARAVAEALGEAVEPRGRGRRERRRRGLARGAGGAVPLRDVRLPETRQGRERGRLRRDHG